MPVLLINAWPAFSFRIDSGTRMHPNSDQLALLSSSLVARNDNLAGVLIDEIRVNGGDREAVRETILQTMLHDGYATALEGVLLLQKKWPGNPEPTELGDYSHHEEWRERGELLFKEIYGDVSDKVIENVSAVSPELATWMVVEGYGKVLSRGVLDTPTRELCTVAVLALKRRPRQLTSHLRGSLRCGVPTADLGRLFDSIASELGLNEAADEARNLLSSLNSH